MKKVLRLKNQTTIVFKPRPPFHFQRTVQMMENLLFQYGIKTKFDNQELFVFWPPKEMAKIPEKKPILWLEKLIRL